MAVQLQDLVGGASDHIVGDGSVRVSGVRHDSRAVLAGDLFVAIPGEKSDGAAFATKAVASGAAALMCERVLDVSVPQLVVADARLGLARAAHRVYGDPSAQLKVIGITGTNGKTTTAWILEAILRVSGARPALLGTVASQVPGRRWASNFTTPEADDFARFCVAANEQEATHLVMEVSSHGLALRRVDGTKFRVAAFLNLSQDHLDFHHSMDGYRAAKARLFTDLAPAASIVNVDDAAGAAIHKTLMGLEPEARGEVWTCSPSGADADISPKQLSVDVRGLRMGLTTPRGELAIESPLVGRHNVENLCVAVASALLVGVAPEDIERGVKGAVGAPGRLERVENLGGATILVDYAHTPDALINAISAVREITPGRVLVVFGCGGDRDKEKRPMMGRAAACGADICVVTSDNPRTEHPDTIVDEILPGMVGMPEQDRAALLSGAHGWVREVDRRRAIHLAVEVAGVDDCVLIAGKGHEDYQIVGKEKRAFDDRQVARAALGGGN